MQAILAPEELISNEEAGYATESESLGFFCRFTKLVAVALVCCSPDKLGVEAFVLEDVFENEVGGDVAIVDPIGAIDSANEGRFFLFGSSKDEAQGFDRIHGEASGEVERNAKKVCPAEDVQTSETSFGFGHRVKRNVWSANRFEQRTEEERFVKDDGVVASGNGFDLRGGEVCEGA